ncbi:nuclear transport factor 2 family protein [Nucisporomicrobium flavum]|jgi:ketosteroid isomerase-like protein|uniref:nuclear transport factor 2 family protein n=1 Tax=Nucisporomicrobium flavum TaxID=2785915 RepID=UPI0018F7759E|nr:nuclear transport factor 2 family protein [Nucisporomicrobium flavum]
MTPPVVERLVAAINAHDLDALTACFAEDFRSVAPAHPGRTVQGRDHVRRNWTVMFEERPDVRAEILASAGDGDEFWSEWDFSGTSRDGTPFHDRGVIVLRVAADLIAGNRWFIEPVGD